MATVPRTRCAERTRAIQPMQLACMGALCAYAQVYAELVSTFHRAFVS